MANLILAAYALTTSLALVLLKLGSQGNALIGVVDNKIHLNITFFGAVGILLYGVSFLIYTYLISKYDLGYIIPLATALVYVLIFIASFLIFKEAFNSTKIAGIIFIIIGMVLLNIHK